MKKSKLNYSKLMDKHYKKIIDNINKIGDKHKKTAFLDLVKRYKEWFSEIKVGAFSIYIGDSILEKNQNLVRAPIMWDHYVFEAMRVGRDGFFGSPGDIEPNQKAPGPTSLGCDYLLNLEGKILYAPPLDEIKKRLEIVNSAHPKELLLNNF